MSQEGSNSVVSKILSTPETAGNVLATAPKEPANMHDNAPKSPEPAQDETLSRRFAALSRQEKELRAMREQFESERTEWQKRQDEYNKANELKEKNVLEWLKAQGMDYETITEAVLNDGKPGADYHIKELEKRIEDKFKTFEQRQAEAEEARKAAQEQQYAQVIEEFKSDITGFFEAPETAEKYELTFNRPDHVELIYDLVAQHYDQSKRMLSIEEAADLLERHFEDEAKTYLQRSKKLANLLGEQTKPMPGSQPKSNYSVSAVSKTLSNEQATQAPTQVYETEARTPEERMRRALEALSRK